MKEGETICSLTNSVLNIYNVLRIKKKKIFKDNIKNYEYYRRLGYGDVPCGR